ncbi:tetratricopeptide repeat protein [Ancylothrix sp. C2]|uniref:tetratricopeptide repeat protein n=1 Tax=Ancylothrix sp. D3o TaxID=2953691 RepID=UPI0021BB8015|nr:tetratricopeptide repeat protein [Ancylothrix sp. D3o]MCT7952359.1 tetratricopeptide repeat protein [Ancylothrix sp. D3o]
MAKFKPTTSAKGFGSSKGQLIAELTKAHAQMRRQNWDQAIEILQNLETKYPQEPDVYISQINLYYEIGDMLHYQYACERLIEIQPNNADATLGLAGAYMTNVRPMLALQTFRRFVETWPQHKKAEEVRETIRELETKTTEIITDLGLTGPDAIEIATLHEKAHGFLELNKYLEAREIEQKILEMCPDFVQAINNISQTYWMEGNLQKAIESCQKVLQINPQNYHALSNISRYLILSGNIEQAKQEAEKLKAVESEIIDIWVKKAEAFSFLGDDDSVLEAYSNAEKAGLLEGQISAPLLYHLAGCAQLRKGNQDQARKIWQKALEIDPNFYLTRVNLNDLNQPVSQRHSPWPFPLANWISQSTIDDLVKAVNEGFKGQDEEAAQKTTQEYLKQHPEIEKLIPILLDRGDPSAREFALQLAKMARTPEMLEALKTFAFGQRGPDEKRHEAAMVLKKTGFLDTHKVEMWLKGEWTEIILVGFEITDEPTVTYSPKVLNMLGKANQALKQRQPLEAEKLLKKCLEIEPENPSLLNNLARAWEQQGRKQEAKNLIQEIYEKHPDYVFACTAIAGNYIEEGEIEAAEKLITPLLSRQKFHASEFAALCNVQVEIAMAKKSPQTAKTWLQMWENSYPEHPGLAYWKKRLNNEA